MELQENNYSFATIIFGICVLKDLRYIYIYIYIYIDILIYWYIFNSRLGLYREAEKQLKSALKHQEMIDTYLYLSKVYIRLDQPLTSVEVYKQGLEKFPGETSLLTGIARIHEVSCLLV